jgi:NADH dehydrogenase [ubiquinone] 1 alpha subcomplex assembly factor 7
MVNHGHDIVVAHGACWPLGNPQFQNQKMTNPLKQKILQMIASTGPLSVAEYMHLCNSHPEYGYYAVGDPLGRKGDFITAPEISQMFGELIAIWCISAWHALDCPNPIQITELGPGRGTLIADFIRTSERNQNFFDAIDITLVETSSSLIKQQQATVKSCKKPVAWRGAIEDLVPVPTLFIANEFLDAIPFRQFVKSGGQWLELGVGVDENDNIAYTRGTACIDEEMLPAGHENEPDGAVFETAPAREAITALIVHHIQNHGGTALIIDYGHPVSGFGDTFQAVQSHQSVSPFANPGNSDLTSHVDFQAIMDAATRNGAKVAGLLSQGEFLLSLGLLERAGRLGQAKSLKLQSQIQNDVNRLVSPGQMGELFKVLCLTNNGLDLPPFNS